MQQSDIYNNHEACELSGDTDNVNCEEYMKKRLRQWLWFIGLYIAGVTTIILVTKLLRYFIPH
jgi:hypothetical protein